MELDILGLELSSDDVAVDYGNMEGSNHAPILHGPNETSCNQKNVGYEVECYLSFVSLWACILLGCFGIVTNSQLLLCYGWIRKLEKSSDKLFFFFGILDTLGCIATISTYSATWMGYSKFACVSNFIMNTSVTQVSLYMLLFTTIARYYAEVLAKDNIPFMSFKKSRILLLCLLSWSSFCLIWNSYTQCERTKDFAEYFILKVAQDNDEKSLFIKVSMIGSIVQGVALVVSTIIIGALYHRISSLDKKGDQSHTTDHSQPKSSLLEQSVSTLVLKWSTRFFLPPLYLHYLAHQFTFWCGERYIGSFYVNPDLIVLLNMATTAINVIILVFNPILFYMVNGYFRYDLSLFWDRRTLPIKNKMINNGSLLVVPSDLTDFSLSLP